MERFGSAISVHFAAFAFSSPYKSLAQSSYQKFTTVPKTDCNVLVDSKEFWVTCCCYQQDQIMATELCIEVKVTLSSYTTDSTIHS